MTDAEVVTLAVAQSIMGIDHRRPVFRGRCASALSHLFPRLPKQPGYRKRRQRLSDTIEWLIGIFAADCPGYHDDLVLLDSTPVECAGARSRPRAARSWLTHAAMATATATPAGFGAMRLHLMAAA